jgi:hypothetical protein
VSSSRLILLVSFVSVLAAGCAKVQARTEPPMPELTPPPPPPRVVETYADDAPVVSETPTETAANAPARNTAKPPIGPAITKPEIPSKPEPPRTEPERPAPQPPALTLKPAPGSASTTEGSIRTLLGRASHDLSRVNYGSLNQDGKTQYDMAKRFMQQAEDALRVGNMVFAGKLADKAATMAAILVR